MNQQLIKPEKTRIREFDMARVFAVIVMIAVHTEFAIYNYETAWFGTLFDYLGSPFAAPVFMFIMGANICLSSKNKPKQLLVRGLSIFGTSIVFNIICHALPFFILDFVHQQTEYAENAFHWVFAVDILTFSGLAFIFFAAVKKLKLNNWVLAGIAVVASVANILLSDNFPFDFSTQPILSALTSLFYNSSVTGYFSFLSWIVFPIAGYLFIQIYRRYPDKNRFYLTAGGIALAAYLVCVLISYKWFPNLPFIEYAEEYSYYRMHPFNAFGTVAFCVAWIGLMYFMSKIIPAAADRHIARLNKNLTNIYLVQWFLINYCFVLPSGNTFFVNEWQYILCFIAIIVAADLIAWGYAKYRAWAKRA